MDPAEPHALGPEPDPGSARRSEDVEVLSAFYRHLGALALRGISDDPDGEGDRWMGSLAKAGYADLANAWENLHLLEDSPTAYGEGLLELVWKTGERLRALHEPARSLEEALEGWEGEEQETEGSEDLETMREHDVRALVHELRVGGLAQKRTAALSLGDFLVHRRKLASEELYQIALTALTTNRDPSVTLEVTECLALLGGSEARRAKATVERVETFFAKFSDRVRHYWDGALPEDPVDELRGSDLVTLGIWLRRAPDCIAGHLAEYLLARLGNDETGALASATSALVPSGDIRLLPVLVRVLQDAGYEARVASIKAMAHIDDPRSLGALLKARRHATDALERVMIARALLGFGDESGREDVLEHLDEQSPSFVREEALKAVGLLPDVDASVIERIEALVESPSSAIALASLRAVSFKGSAATVEWLERMAAERVTLRAAAMRAAGDLRARLSLDGDESLALESRDPRPASGRRPSVLARLRSVMWYLTGLLLVGLRRWRRGREAAARASRINPSSAKGYFLEGYVRVQEGRDDAAIECYRRGFQVDALFAVRQWGEADRVLGAYLRHAESLERRHGRRDEAIALLEETDFIDLRSADPNLKIEVDRRLDSLKLERRRERLEGEAS